jgi:hypothetical protein
VTQPILFPLSCEAAVLRSFRLVSLSRISRNGWPE